MKVFYLALLIFIPHALNAELPPSHPLQHPKLVVKFRPTGVWINGWMYVHEVAAYILGSDEECAAARAILEREGFGPNGFHYLYCGDSDKPAVVDGLPFKTRKEAIEYLWEKKITIAFYFSTGSSFPATIPGELTYRGTAFRVLDRFK